MHLIGQLPPAKKEFPLRKRLAEFAALKAMKVADRKGDGSKEFARACRSRWLKRPADHVPPRRTIGQRRRLEMMLERLGRRHATGKRIRQRDALRSIELQEKLAA